jgi:hypothetical protein
LREALKLKTISVVAIYEQELEPKLKTLLDQNVLTS